MEANTYQMPYREKTAWLSLFSILVTFAPCFVITALSGPTPPPLPGFRQLALLGGILVVQMLLMAGGHIFLALKTPEDARTRPDERDIAIMHRGITNAYYVLICGMLIVGCVMPFNSGGWSIVNAALLMIVIAELIHYVVIVAAYRGHR